LGYQLVRQNGRILLHLELLERQLARLGTLPGPALPAAPGPPPGLAPGSTAPEFELPDLTGNRRSLSAFRGKRLLLIFFNPRCGFCAQMAPELAALPTDGTDGRPVPLVVSTGDPEENRQLARQHDIRCPVLLQEQMEVASQCQAHGTAMGYLIDEQGRIASEIAVGSQGILALSDPSAAPTVSANGHREHRGNRSLAYSRIQRNGLASGTPAPGFTSPTLDGTELSLEQFRGRQVLFVFSDPQCGPCNQLMPELEQFHRRTGHVQVLMVSRGDIEANRQKAEEHRLTFPIVLQKQWEVSRAYAMFATPVAYLIDENGVITADVATGVEPIEALLSHATDRRCKCGRIPGECGCGKTNGRATASNDGNRARRVILRD
jgi:peroxiredoxin